MKVEVVAWSAPARAAAAVLQALAVVNVLYLANHLLGGVLEGYQTAPPQVIALGLLLFSGTPLVVVALLRRLFRGTLEIAEAQLVLTLRGARFEIPREAVTAVRPWRLPFPDAGIVLVMKSGKPFRYRLASGPAGDLVSALREALPAGEGLAGSGGLAYAGARPRRGRLFWAIKYGLAPLVITVIAFRLDQIIKYGGPFGQYRMYGLGPYLESFARMWMGYESELMIYAAVWRIAAELVALPLTLAMPARARGIRLGAEIVCFIAYFVLIPGFLVFLFFFA